ncbi:MAG: tyrosine-protein kinase family protein, partial [Gloeobacteraceae cyanobacterium ES-bin-316]|nr:tyrosine-protein kinase family protein [Ferruginibacter sp.]
MVEQQKKVNRVITFYSYKGGVGRSMAMANIGVLLAKWGFKTLLIDWDLEAPGMENYFKDHLDVYDVQQKKGLIDLLSLKEEKDKIKVEDLNWESFTTTIRPDKNTQLDLITAGKRDETYFAKVRQFDYNSFYANSDGGQYIEDLRDYWLEKYDFILIDSRTGLTDSSGICSIHMPDILVLLFTPNHQSFNGIKEVAEKAINGQKQIIYDRFRLRVLPVPCRIENAETLLLDEWMKKIYTECEPMLEWLPRKETNIDEFSVSPADIIGQIKIPYKTLYAYGERLAVTERGTNDTQDLGYVYENIAAVLANDLQNIHLIKDARDLLIKKAKGEEVIDYTELERKYADQQQATTQLTEELKKKETFIAVKTQQIQKKKTRLIWILSLSALLIAAAFYIVGSINNNSAPGIFTNSSDSIIVGGAEEIKAADFAATYSTSSQQAELDFNLMMAGKYAELDKAYQDTFSNIKQKIEYAISYRFQDIADSFYLLAKQNPAGLLPYFSDTVASFGTLSNMPAKNLTARLTAIYKSAKTNNTPLDTTFSLTLHPLGFKAVYNVTGNVLLDKYNLYKAVKTQDTIYFNPQLKIRAYSYKVNDTIPLIPLVKKTVVEVFFCPSVDKQSYSRANAIVNALKANKNFIVSSKNNFNSSKDPSSPYYFTESQVRYNGNEELKIAGEIQQVIKKSTSLTVRIVPARTPTKNYLSVFICDQIA